jgi:hypothetical protein
METRDILEQMSKQDEDPVYLIGSAVILLLAVIIRYARKQKAPTPSDEDL